MTHVVQHDTQKEQNDVEDLIDDHLMDENTSEHALTQHSLTLSSSHNTGYRYGLSSIHVFIGNVVNCIYRSFK